MGAYICDVCNEFIAPKIVIDENGVTIENSSTQIRGGLGNKVLSGKVCDKCVRMMQLMENLKCFGN